MSIDKDQTIAELLQQKPQAAQVFMKHGMPCLGCIAASGETVAQAAMAHGIDLEALIRDLEEATA